MSRWETTSKKASKQRGADWGEIRGVKRNIRGRKDVGQGGKPRGQEDDGDVGMKYRAKRE